MCAKPSVFDYRFGAAPFTRCWKLGLHILLQLHAPADPAVIDGLAGLSTTTEACLNLVK